jgi:plastocyanin
MKTLASALAVTLSLIGAVAGAADLQVNVVTAAGRPAADVVLLLTHANAGPVQALRETVPIVQKDLRFEPYVTVVPVGSTVRFTNRDSYDHHVRSLPAGPLGSVAPAKQFEFRLPASKRGAESTADIALDVAGGIVLGCHIHNSMRGHLVVTAAPWSAVTDEFGRATLKGVPDGAAELRLWHPDQISDQPAQALQVSATVTVAGQLNFNPRRRPPPPPKVEYKPD